MKSNVSIRDSEIRIRNWKINITHSDGDISVSGGSREADLIISKAWLFLEVLFDAFREIALSSDRSELLHFIETLQQTADLVRASRPCPSIDYAAIQR